MKLTELKSHIRNSLLILLFTIIYLSVGLFFLNLFKNERLPDSLWVNGMAVSGMTLDQIFMSINKNLPESIHVKFYIDNEIWDEQTLYLSSIGLRYPKQTLHDKLQSFTRDISLLQRLDQIHKKNERQDIELKLDYDDVALYHWVESQAMVIYRDPIQPEIYMENGKIVLQEGIDGVYLDAEKLQQLLQLNISRHDFSDIEFFLNRVAPDEAIKENDDFTKEISKYLTPLEEHENRIINIRLASQMLHGYRLEPNASFSFNEVVGKASEDAGYRMAPVIQGGVFVDGIGGGICQVSSTLYQAALHGGMIIQERRNHSLPVGYLPVGMDAVIVYGQFDLKFQNPYTFPVLILAWVHESHLHVALYGSQAFEPEKIRIQSRYVEEIPHQTRIIEDQTLNKGVEFVEHPGAAGYRVTVYRVQGDTKAHYREERLSVDYYRPLDRVVRMGVKDSH